jgi:hypothetical protein
MAKGLDLVDLYTVLKRRNVSIEEWLEFHEINSIRDLNEKGEQIAAEKGYYLSEEFRVVALPLAQARAEKDFQKALDITRARSKAADTSPELEKVATTKEQKRKKKVSSNEVESVVVSDTSDTATEKQENMLTVKENSDESNQS